MLDSIAKTHNATPAQIALAWLLKRSPVMLPIPGTSKVSHLEENVAVVKPSYRMSVRRAGPGRMEGIPAVRLGLRPVLINRPVEPLGGMSVSPQ
jgi:hypothetical protein